jgi:DNA-binding LytR/AlgR family response regulator
MYHIILIHPVAALLNKWTDRLNDIPGFSVELAVESLQDAEQLLQAGDYHLLIAQEKIITAAGSRTVHYPVWISLVSAAASSVAATLGKGCFASIAEDAEFVQVFQLLQTVRTFFQERQLATSVHNNFIFVKSEYKLIKIQLADILYLSGLRDYTQIFLKGKVSPLTTLQNLKDFESRLPANDFIRVHRSYIVALSQVETISRNEITIGNNTLPIGHAYRPMLDEMIGKNG